MVSSVIWRVKTNLSIECWLVSYLNLVSIAEIGVVLQDSTLFFLGMKTIFRGRHPFQITKGSVEGAE